jgi:excinuclease ABC subunit A
VLDLGPEGGDRGGEVVAQGTPEEVAETPGSHTGEFLKRVLPVYEVERALVV